MSLASGLPRASLARAATTRLLVLPLGSIARDVYESLLGDLRRVGSVLPLASLPVAAAAASRHGHGARDTTFKTTNWQRSRMRIEFIDGAVVDSDTGEWLVGEECTATVSSPRSLVLNSDWDELHVFGKVMGVICVCHHPTADLAAAQQQFQDVRAQLLHPGGPFIYKVYAFDADTASGPESPREHWSLLPSAGGVSEAHGDLFLRTSIQALACEMLDNFEASIKKLPHTADLRSPLDASSAAASSSQSGGISPSEAQARAKKVRGGRQKKYIGDYCLLAADPAGALKHFKAAADAARSANDPVWHSSALEGQAAALVALEEEKDASLATFLPAVSDLLEESLTTLARLPYASSLSIETSFQLARYLAQWSRRCDAADVLMRMYELKMDCSAHDQIALAVEASILCHQMGFRRKFGFFLVQAAGLYRELHQSASCHALLRMAAVAFRIDGFSQSIVEPHGEQTEGDDLDASPMPSLDSRDLHHWHRALDATSSADPRAYLARISHMSSAKRKERGFRVGRWVFIQKSILEHLIFSAKQMQDDELTASCTSYLLRTLYPWLDASYQTSLVNDLWACTRLMPINVGAVDLTGLPVVHSIRPIEPDEGAMPYVDPLDDEAPPSEEEHDEDADPTEVENETAVGTCARLRRAEAAASGDVFLARPDEAKGKQPTRQVGNTRTDDTPTATADSKLRYVSGESLSVEVVLSNPLSVPLQLQHVSLATSGVPFDAFVVACTLPPATLHHRIVLVGVPRATGTLNIRGAVVRAFNLVCEHRCDEHGRAIRPEYDDPDSSAYCPDPPAPVPALAAVNVRSITILAPLPLVRLSYSVSGNLASASALLLGEERVAHLLVHNVGPTPIDDAELRVAPRFRAMTTQSQAAYYANPEELAEIARNLRARQGTAAAPHHQSLAPPPPPATMSRRLVTFDTASIRAQLPLQPGAVMKIKLDIIAHTECCGADFTFSYAVDPASRMFRCSRYPVSWSAEHGLRLDQLHVHPFSAAHTTHSSSTTNDAAAAADDEPDPPVAVSQPTSALARLTSDDCMVILELTNTSSANFRIACTLDGVPYKPSLLSVEKRTEKRLILPLPRMSFGSCDDDDHLRRLVHDLSTGVVDKAHWQKDAICLRLLRSFRERVRLTWTSSEESRGVLAGMCGDVGLAPVEITPIHLFRLLPDPIEFRATLTPVDTTQEDDDQDDDTEHELEHALGTPVFLSPKSTSTIASTTASSPMATSVTTTGSGSETRALVGSFHRLTVELLNRSSSCLGPVSLSILAYQESVGGRLDTRLEHKLLLAGTLTRRFERCQPTGTERDEQHRCTHSLLVCFTSVGRFNFQFVATHSTTPQQAATTTLPPPAQQTTSTVAAVAAAALEQTDPFAILSAFADATEPAAPLSVVALRPPTSTIRRRSVVPTDATITAAAAGSLAEEAHTQLDQYQLDVNSSSDEDDDDSQGEAALHDVAPTASPPPRTAELVYRCPHIMVVQAVGE